jgi:apolipoprotein N-acyltransferase
MRLFAGLIYVAAVLLAVFFSFFGPYPILNPGWADTSYFLILFLHLLWASVLIFRRRGRREASVWYYRGPEVLLSISLLFFLFSYIFALNANMDYVQRFIATEGNLRLAQDTTVERLITAVRFGPLLAAGLFGFLVPRLGRRRHGRLDFPRSINEWAFLLVLASSVLTALSFPSFISLDGLSFLAFVALVPLFVVLKGTSYGWGLFYGVVYGIFFNLVMNFWLGPYSLVSLQAMTVLILLYYFFFMAITLWLFKKCRYARFLIFPAAWVLFDYLRSAGFLGFPWGFLGATQYQFLPLIQISSITGIWGVSFVVLLINSGLTEALHYRWRAGDRGRMPLAPLAVSFGLFFACLLGGAAYLFLRNPGANIDKTVRVALIQQNSDPRKHNYRDTFDTLKEMTDQSIEAVPDLVAWSETAFVPSIRRWSAEDPESHSLAALVRDFLDYQRATDTWLLTGNDDYTYEIGETGRRERLDYNAALLYSPSGDRVATYHKNRLVPFTEYFKYRRQFPWLYDLLLKFDVTFWQPGEERTIFRHPLFSFGTPICFEDTFPSEIRRFVLAGADAIINLANDYWSLTEVEAKQHFVGALFRAVENRRPLLRATASGLTSYVTTEGRLVAGLPYYTEDYLVVDVPIEPVRYTVYTRLGDWFPFICFLTLLLLLVLNVFPRAKTAGNGERGE